MPGVNGLGPGLNVELKSFAQFGLDALPWRIAPKDVRQVRLLGQSRGGRRMLDHECRLQRVSLEVEQ